jgi:hypothetical protein
MSAIHSFPFFKLPLEEQSHLKRFQISENVRQEEIEELHQLGQIILQCNEYAGENEVGNEYERNQVHKNTVKL